MGFSCDILVPADDANAVSPNSTRRIRGSVMESSSSVRPTRTRGCSARCRSRIHTCLSEGQAVLFPLREASSSSTARGLLLPSCRAFDDATRPIAPVRNGVIHRRISVKISFLQCSAPVKTSMSRSNSDLASLAVPQLRRPSRMRGGVRQNSICKDSTLSKLADTIPRALAEHSDNGRDEIRMVAGRRDKGRIRIGGLW